MAEEIQKHNFDLARNIEISEVLGGITHKDSVKANFDILIYRFNSKNHAVDKNILKSEIADLSLEDIEYLIEVDIWGDAVLTVLKEAKEEKKKK